MEHSTKLFMITFDDGDFYCEGNHCWGIYSTREAAEQRIEALKELPETHYDLCKSFGVGEWTLDEDVISAD